MNVSISSVLNYTGSRLLRCCILSCVQVYKFLGWNYFSSKLLGNLIIFYVFYIWLSCFILRAISYLQSINNVPNSILYCTMLSHTFNIKHWIAQLVISFDSCILTQIGWQKRVGQKYPRAPPSSMPQTSIRFLCTKLVN